MIKVTAGQSIYEVEEGTTLEQLAKQLQKKEEPVILLAYMDGKLTELFTEINCSNSSPNTAHLEEIKELRKETKEFLYGKPKTLKL